MSRFVLGAAALWAAASLGACASNPTPVLHGGLAITNVSVVDVEHGRVVPGRTVIIDGGRIRQIAAAAEMPQLAGDVTVIDGRGRFLAPGLADMHVHIWDEHEPALYVSYGVTTVRVMWGEATTLALRRRIEAGEVIGPRMIVSGAILDGAPRIWPTSVEVTTAEAAREAVNDQVAAGFDFIKVYSNLSPATFDAIAERAREREIPFAGHVPEAVPIRHALEQGMGSMEHLLGFDAATVRPGFELSGASLTGQSRIAIARRVARGELRLQDVFDADALEALSRDIAASGVWVTPTLIVQRQVTMTRAEARAAFSAPEIAYVQPAFRALWNPDSEFRRRGVSDDDLSALQVFRQVALDRVRALHAAGARLLAGTDAPNPFVFHGASLHEELGLLTQAGLSPVEAIRAATTNAATYAEEAGEWGVVSEGARADLVLLSANPLRDVSAYRGIEGVSVGGRWFGPDALADMRAAAAAAYSGSTQNLSDSTRLGLMADEH